MPNKIPLCKPTYLMYLEEVKAEVNKVLDSGFISMGKKVAEFEQAVSEYVGCRHTVAVSSGTAALTMCVQKYMQTDSADENVITTPFSFVATAGSIIAGGGKPKFVDVDRDTYNINLDAVNNMVWTSNEKGLVPLVMPVDVFGIPVDTNKIFSMAPSDKWKILIDACESFGTKAKRPYWAMTYGFYSNKSIGMGEGGCICTNDSELADYCRAYRNQGRIPGDTHLQSSVFGLNFRMMDIQAAIGLVQLKHIYEIIQSRLLSYAVLAHTLGEKYASRPVIPPCSDKFCTRINPFVFTIEVDNRDKVMQKLLDMGVECREYFPTIHKQPAYKQYKHMSFPVAEEISSRTLAIPFWSGMDAMDIINVASAVERAVE